MWCEKFFAYVAVMGCEMVPASATSAADARQDLQESPTDEPEVDAVPIASQSQTADRCVEVALQAIEAMRVLSPGLADVFEIALGEHIHSQLPQPSQL